MFSLPTINDLAERSRQAFRRNLKGSDAWVWPNNIYVSAKVIAGAVFEVFGFAAYIQRQVFAHTAPDIESLRLHGNEFGIPQKPAAPAWGNVVFTASSALTVDTGALLQRGDGAQYRVSSGGALPTPGTLLVPVIAVQDGAAGNVIGGAPLSITSGVTGDALVAVHSAGIALGEDIEDIESYRKRILFRKRNPPHGGAPSDYVLWASEVAGVTRVFVERLWNGPGTVRVFPLMDGLFADGIPDVASVERVGDYLETVSPAGALVTVAAPTAHPIDVTITGLAPDTVDVREAVMAELREAFFRLGRVSGSDGLHSSMPYLASPAVFSRSWVWQAVANATGEERHILTAPAADVALSAGQLPTLGNVTFL